MREERGLERRGDGERDRGPAAELEREMVKDLSPTDEEANDVLGGTLKCYEPPPTK